MTMRPEELIGPSPLAKIIPVPSDVLESFQRDAIALEARLVVADAENERLLTETVRLRGELSRTTMLLERARHGGKV